MEFVPVVIFVAIACVVAGVIILATVAILAGMGATFAVVFGPLARLAGQQADVRSVQWKQMAAVLGLTVGTHGANGLEDLSGAQRGLAVTVSTTLRSSGKHTRRYTIVRTRLSRPVGVELGPEGVLTPLFTSLGMQDLQTGDAAFDPRFVVKGKDEAAVHAVLGPAARAAALGMLDAVGHYHVADDEIVWETGEFESNPDRIAAVLQWQDRLARALMGESE